VILRYDRLGVEIPAGDRDPASGMAVQELMRGSFGEMSTLMNYTFQSFGFRGRKELRSFYDLIANISAEEDGHIEAVGATITTMLNGAHARQIVEQGSPAHFLKSGFILRFPRRSDLRAVATGCKLGADRVTRLGEPATVFPSPLARRKLRCVRWRRAGLAVGAAVVATEETETLRRSPTASSGPLERGQHPESEGGHVGRGVRCPRAQRRDAALTRLPHQRAGASRPPRPDLSPKHSFPPARSAAPQ
jgi:hypothetical protein